MNPNPSQVLHTWVLDDSVVGRNTNAAVTVCIDRTCLPVFIPMRRRSDVAWLSKYSIEIAVLIHMHENCFLLSFETGQGRLFQTTLARPRC